MAERILVVDDDVNLRQMLAEGLSRAGYVVDAVPDLEGTMEFLATLRYGAAIVDLTLSNNTHVNGSIIIRFLREHAPWSRIVLLTGDISPASESIARRYGVDAFLSKPQKLENIVTKLQELLAVDEKQREILVAAIEEAKEIRTRIKNIRFTAFESQSAQVAVDKMLAVAAPPLLQSIKATCSLLSRLGQTSVRIQRQTEVEDTFDDAFSEASLETKNISAVDGEPQTRFESFFEQWSAVLAHVGKSRRPVRWSENYDFVYGMLISELERSGKRFAEACHTRNRWKMITEGGECIRKTEKALHAGLTLKTQKVDPVRAEGLWSTDNTEVRSSIVVRNTLCAFREDSLKILNIDMKSGPAVLITAGQSLLSSLKALFGSDNYEHLRGEDRFQLRQFAQRLEQLLEQGTDTLHDLSHLLADIKIFADLLGSVNQREALLEHDRRTKLSSLDALRDLAATLEDPPADGGWEQYRVILEGLQTMAFRDVNLDRWVAAELNRGVDVITDIPSRVVQTLNVVSEVRV